jgi:hypothetical protein
LAQLVKRASKEREDWMVLLVKRVSKEDGDWMVRLVKRVNKERAEPEAKPVLKDYKVRLVLKVREVKMESLV